MECEMGIAHVACNGVCVCVSCKKSFSNIIHFYYRIVATYLFYLLKQHTHTHTITCYMGYAHYAFHGDINENDKLKIFTKILTNNNKLNISKVN